MKIPANMIGIVIGLMLVVFMLPKIDASGINLNWLNFEWVELTGPWIVTHYGLETDGYLNQRTGASWNGIVARDWATMGYMSDKVTLDSYCGAMPGPEFYGMPVLVCLDDECVLFTAVDVPAENRIRLDGVYYVHVDLCQRSAEELGVIDAGIVTGARVYIGEYKGGKR